MTSSWRGYRTASSWCGALRRASLAAVSSAPGSTTSPAPTVVWMVCAKETPVGPAPTRARAMGRRIGFMTAVTTGSVRATSPKKANWRTTGSTTTLTA